MEPHAPRLYLRHRKADAWIADNNPHNTGTGMHHAWNARFWADQSTRLSTIGMWASGIAVAAQIVCITSLAIAAAQ